MALTVVFGLVFTLAATFVAMALLVRTSFGRVPHAITFLPVPLVLYDAWMSTWFVFESLRQFALTAMTPASALRLVAFVFLVASLLSLGFLYGCVSVVQQFLDGAAARRVRRAAKYAATVFGALLVVGWSAYHFNANAVLFSTSRAVLRWTVLPLSLGAWLWLWKGGTAIADAAWRGQVRQLAQRYVAVFSTMLAVSLVRDRLEAFGAAIPLVIDVFLTLGYTLVTVVWVESAQEAARPSAHQAMP